MRPGNSRVIERRSGKRILTLKNFRNVLIVALALFVVLTIRSEMRGKNQDDYGRLVRKELPDAPAAKPLEVVTETPSVEDQASADPMLIEPAARAQFLGDTTLQPVPLIDPTTTQAPATQPGEGRVVIVGGTEGVSIVRDPKPQLPKLGGGFGKP